jgi:hypothetical protein
MNAPAFPWNIARNATCGRYANMNRFVRMKRERRATGMNRDLRSGYSHGCARKK